MDKIDMKTIDDAFEEGVTGCTIQKDRIKWGRAPKDFTIILTSAQGALSISYISDNKETMKCVEHRPFSMLSYPG